MDAVVLLTPMGRALLEGAAESNETACHHALHGRCRLCCKFCGNPCGCECHDDTIIRTSKSADGTYEGAAVRVKR